jgi:hypothetical protein
LSCSLHFACIPISFLTRRESEAKSFNCHNFAGLNNHPSVFKKRIILIPHIQTACYRKFFCGNRRGGVECNRSQRRYSHLFTLMPALPSEFSPVLWLDANDSSTVIQSSGAVSTWQDKSGNNYHFTQDSDTSRRPLYSATSLNGMPAITFDGSNDYLSISSRLGFSANPDISVFAVTSFISNIATDNRIFQLGNNAHSLAVAGGSGSWSWRFNGGK